MAVKAYETFLVKGRTYENLRVRANWIDLLEKLMHRAQYFGEIGVALPDANYEGRREFTMISAAYDRGFGCGIDPIEGDLA